MCVEGDDSGGLDPAGGNPFTFQGRFKTMRDYVPASIRAEFSRRAQHSTKGPDIALTYIKDLGKGRESV